MPNDVYIKQADAVFAVQNRIEQIGMENNPYVCSIRQAVRDVPAADVELVRKWIPVTERLPETNEKVLVYVFDPDFCGPYIEFGHWLNWLKRWGEFDDEVGDFGDYTIIAWMPLPEPPKEDKEEDHADTEI